MKASYTRKRKIITIAITYTFVVMGFLNIFDIYKDSYLISQEISTSAPHAVIFVNGNSGPSGLDTFPDTTGNGTEINPYIIENFEINGSGAGTCIEIRNTDKYLVIKNCTIENSGTGSLDSGIYLSNCTNVVIRNNTINNCRNGIYLYSGTQNCTIEKNILFDHVDGLKIEDSINNKIFRNVIENNSQYGIYLTGTSNNNRIVINSLSGNEYSQAYTDTSGIGNYWSNSILGNFWGDYQSRYPSASQVGAVWDIPYLINGSLNQYDEHPLINFIGVHAPIILEGNSEVDAFFAGNGTNGNSWLSAHVLDGFKIIAGEFSNCIEIKNTDRYLVISNNYVTGAAGYWENAGIKLQNCSNINISSNVAANNSIGIYIHQSSNTNVSSNNASSNIGDGFFIYYSNYINLSGNKGIGNLQDGIEIRSSHNNTLDSSVFLGNGQNGINIDDGDDNTIISNNVLNNKQGILINYASFNNVSINNITRNTINGIHLISNSDNNTIFNNSIEDCVYGIEIVDSRFTTLLNNTLLNCGVGVSGTINQVGTHVMDTSNLVNSNILYYYANQTNLSSSNFTNGSQVILANCTNSFLSDINANNVTDGVLLLYSNFTVITASNFSNNAHSGINATYGVGNNISFNNFSHNTESIALHYEMNAMVHNNVMNDSYIAVSVTAGSYNHTFYENKMVNGGFYIAGNVASASTLDINTTNKVNGKPVYYYYNQVSLDSSNFSNPGQIMLINCNHSSLSNVKIFNATSGIVLRYCYNFSLSGIECQSNSISGFTFSKVFNSSFVDCNVTQNENGILLGASEENVFSGMNITANDDTGIRLINSNYNNFTNCLIQHNRYGYRAAGIFQSSDYNKLHESNISYNREYGIWLDESDNNEIINNNISFNGIYGVYLTIESELNELNHNIIVDNGWSEAYCRQSNNIWDNGTKGNFWGDYVIRYPNATLSGDIWNTSYKINGSPGLYDYFPFYRNFFPVANFSANTTIIIVDQQVHFSFTGYTGDWPATVQWNFGDGTGNATGFDPVHQFDLVGNFTIGMMIQDRDGEMDHSSGLIVVLDANGDFDKDSVTNALEIDLYGTNPLSKDTDGDGMWDGYETSHGVLDPLVDDAFEDPDGDGLVNLDEFEYNTNPNSKDTDNDGFSDLDEVNWFTDPTDQFLNPITQWVVIPTIIILCIILITIFTKRRAKKKYDLLMGPVEITKEEEIDIEAAISKGSTSFQRLLSEKREMISRVLEPTIPEPVPIIPSKIGKKKNQPKVEKIDEDEIERKIDEKTEREVDVIDQKENCIVCENELKATFYICPSCGTKYCVRCAIILSERNEGCWTCKNILDFHKH